MTGLVNVVQQDNLIFSLVEIFGHDWKLMANKYLPRRAPLSIKNHYSLLMRRLKRQNGKQQHRSLATPTKTLSSEVQPCTNDNVAAFTPNSRLQRQSQITESQGSAAPDMSTSSSTQFTAISTASTNQGASMTPNVTVDLSQLLSCNVVSNVQNGHGPMDQFHYSANQCYIGRGLGDNQQHNQDAVETGWDGHEICNGVDLNGLQGSEGMCIASEYAQDQTSSPQGGLGIGTAGSDGVEFSVTCSRSKLKAMVCLVFEGLLSETAGLPEQELVTVALSLKR